MSVAFIKNVTGHTSDTVVQRYIDNSETLKLNAANALSITKRKRESQQDQDNDQQQKKVITNINIQLPPSSNITTPLITFKL